MSISTTHFGHTDLLVSKLCQGTAFRHLPRADDGQAEYVLRHCMDVGINFFDSSNAYGWGGSERVLGKAIEGHRNKVVICTKIAASLEPETPDAPGRPVAFTRSFLFEQAEDSLSRLGTDYIDLYLLHQPDRVTSPEDIVSSMEALVQAGKIRYWGVSNHPSAEVEAYVSLSQTSNTPIAGVEEYYTIAGTALDSQDHSRVGQLEQKMFPVLKRFNLGLLAFSPMDMGYLAPEKNYNTDSPYTPLIQEIDTVARTMETSRAAVCVAWVLTHQEATCVLAGAESPAHVDENLTGTRLVLPPDLLDRLNKASAAFREAFKG